MELDLSVQSLCIGLFSLIAGHSLKTVCPACPPCPSLSCEHIVWFPAILCGLVGIAVGLFARRFADRLVPQEEPERPVPRRAHRFLRAIA